MNWSRLLHPSHLAESLGGRARRRRRLRRLRGTVAASLCEGHIDSLELLELVGRDPDPIRTIYDLGANIGTWTRLAAALLPEAALHAFEPLPAHADAFARATGDLPQVQLHRIALGPAAATAQLKLTSFSDAASLLDLADASRAHYGLAEGPSVPVPVERLDDWAARHHLPMPDLIKLDLQGYELAALAGAPRCLAGARYVLSEVSFVEFYRGQPLFAEVVGALDRAGFELQALAWNVPGGEPLTQTDALFRRRPARP